MEATSLDSKTLDRFYKLRKMDSDMMTEEETIEYEGICKLVAKERPDLINIIKDEEGDEEEGMISVEVGDFASLMGSLNTLYKLARVGMFKYASAAGISPEEMDNMYKIVTALNAKYNG